MTRRPLRIVVLLVVALALVPFLPLYVERTMLRSWRVDRVGDTIEWGWKLCTLGGYWSNQRYMSPEQRPALWLSVNLALAFVYALLIALGVELLIRRRAKGRSSLQ